jgi:hypothetical protein
MGKPKRPRDTNQLAKFIVDVSTGQIPSPDPFQGKDRELAERGQRGGLKGGKARADSLSAARRKQIAKRAATARWQMAKQMVSRKLRPATRQDPFWQPRYYDFNVWSERKRVEKLRYLHRNPVKRGLAASPEDWIWSSFRHYATGEDGAVEIESQWTARKREQLGVYPTVGRCGSG